MKKSKLIVLVLALVMSFSLFAAGCGVMRDKVDEDEHMNEVIATMDAQAFSADIDPNFTGSLKVWAMSKDTEFAAIMRFVESFNEKYPNIKVDVQTFSADAYINSIKNLQSAAVNANDYSDVADVFWITNETIPSLVTMEMLAPINYLDDKDDSFSTDDLVDSMVEDSKFNGKLYMMPRDYNQFVLFYNKWLFDQYDIIEPVSDQAMTNEEFEDLCASFHSKMISGSKTTPAGGQTGKGRVIDVNWNWGSMAYGTFKMFGGGVTDGKGNVIYDSQENLNAVKWVKNAVSQGWCATPDKVALGTDFKLYQTPFLIETRAVFMDIVKNASVNAPLNDYIGAAPMPMLGGEDNYAVGAGCSGYAMNTYATHPTEAWLFLKHIVSAEGQNAYGTTGNSVPVLESLIDDPDAAWRATSFAGYDLSEDFSHDAFVYKYKTHSCTMADFKAVIPAQAVGRVATCMQSGMANGVKNTGSDMNEEAIKKVLSTQASAMEKEIEKYK